MNNSETKKVLVFEHPWAISAVKKRLEEIEKETGETLDVRIIENLAEAQAQICQADLAIVEVENDGRHVAHIAVELGVPIITTSLFFDPESLSLQTARMKMILKPQYYGFEEAVKELLTLIRIQGSGHIVLTA